MRRRRKARSRKRPPKQGPRYVWVSTDKGVVWRDDQGASGLMSTEQVREELKNSELAEAERARLEAEQARQAAAAAAPIEFKCPMCKTPIRVPVEDAGEKTHCPGCRSSMLVPEKNLVPKKASYIQCLECDALARVGSQQCAECRQPLPEEKSCSKCGDVIVRVGVMFCATCGFELEDRE